MTWRQDGYAQGADATIMETVPERHRVVVAVSAPVVIIGSKGADWHVGLVDSIRESHSFVENHLSFLTKT